MATQLRNFVNNLEQVVTQKKVERAITIAKGNAPNMEAYHRACGRIEGMEAVIGFAKEMLNKMRDAEEGGKLPEMPDLNAGEA